MKKLLFSIAFGAILPSLIPVFAQNFTYTYEGQTVTYTVLDEDAKTCATKAGVKSPIVSGIYPIYSYSGNEISGDLILPSNPKYGDVEYSLTEIGDFSFGRCYDLTSITIPNTVKKIGTLAFRWCENLTSLKIPESVQEFTGAAFVDCNGLVKAEFASIEHLCKINFSSYYDNPLSIAKHLYIDGEEITEVVIPESVSAIGNYTFSGCNNLKSITIPNSVFKIGIGAFEDCSALTYISIPISVESIGFYAFSGCDGLVKAEFANIEHLCKIIFGSEDANPLSMAKHLYINGEEITELVIPESVSSIGNYTFFGYNSLKSVVINGQVSKIGYSAFRNCTNLTSVIIYNSLETIDDFAFSNCVSLTSLEIPNSVTSIGDYTFDGCISLTSMVIPNSVTSIGNRTFANCTGLSSVVIPNSVTSIGDWAFQYCTGLTSVVFPNSVTSIGDRAFYGCTGLTSIVFPNSVTSIGNRAFFDCYSLNSIYYNTENPIECNGYILATTKNSITNNRDTYIYENATLYMPAKGIEKAKEISPWKIFIKKQEYDFGGVADAIADKAGEIDYTLPYEIYNFNGTKVGDNKDTLAPGLYIIRQGTTTKKISVQ